MAHSDYSQHNRRSRCSAARVATVAGYPELRYEVQCPACRAYIPADNLEDAGEIARRHRAGTIIGIELADNRSGHADHVAVSD